MSSEKPVRTSPKKLCTEEPWLEGKGTLQFQESLQSPGLTEEELPDPISQSIEPEVWNPEEPFRGFKGMTSQNPKLHPESQVNGGEVGRGRRQDHQGLKTVIGQATDILEAIP